MAWPGIRWHPTAPSACCQLADWPTGHGHLVISWHSLALADPGRMLPRREGPVAQPALALRKRGPSAIPSRGPAPYYADEDHLRNAFSRLVKAERLPALGLRGNDTACVFLRRKPSTG
jgi:hypothetical protein